MEKIPLIIDGKNISCKAGASVLDAARENGIDIPSLCHHRALKPFGACRLCLVEDKKTGRLMASCVTPAARDMELLTSTPRVIKRRKDIVRLMIAEHPESCLVCDKGNRCELRRIAAQLGVGEAGLYAMPNHSPIEQANPFISRDLSKCVLCGKCVRADHELVVVGAIDYHLRGFKSRPAALHDGPLESSECVFCGACVSMCPTGALFSPSWFVGTPEKESVSICGFCGVGCNLTLGVSGGRVVEAGPAHIEKSVNDATSCVRGHFAHDFLNSPDRLEEPRIRKDGDLTPVSWDEAAGFVARRLLEIREQSGGDSVAFLGSSKCSNEENYLFQKIARLIVGTSHIDNGGYMGGRRFLSLIEGRTDPMRRFDFFAGPLSGLEKAEAVWAIGADPGHLTPVAGYCLRRGASRGVPIVLSGPVPTDLADFATLQAPPPDSRKGGYPALIRAVSAELIRRRAYDESFIDRFTKGFADFRDPLLTPDMDVLARMSGLDADVVKSAADLLENRKIAFVIGENLAMEKRGVEALEALLNLAVMTGSIAHEGAGFYLLAGENNMVGAWDMGAVPDALPGRRLLSDDSARKMWEEAWEGRISSEPGLDMAQIVEAAEKGKIKAMYVMGENPLRSLPDQDRVLKAFEKIDFLAVQDILDNETVRLAHVALPGAAFAEKSGSFTNMEGARQVFSAAAIPPGRAMPDLEILGRVAEKMGWPGLRVSDAQVRDEIEKVLGVNGRFIWTREKGKSPGAAREESRVPFAPCPPPSDGFPEANGDGDFPLTAFLVFRRFHLGSGTRTSRSARISEFNAGGDIGISSKDALELGLDDGDMARVTSENGRVSRRVRVSADAPAGTVLVPRGFFGNDAVNLTGLTRLFSPEGESWTSCRVRVEKM
ncbi:conserved hypothetical protein [Candidatus Desulfarcum epimagneticum]|uniref:Uncharacterized protein n=1 Tax=uncultured Desulfobacteraceae bacterium TaxID=218296 RepID=A0A484HHZ3_9BACT|nr:conserved hypothetical protein [uncultured Desulfobacteraceae bacterium]